MSHERPFTLSRSTEKRVFHNLAGIVHSISMQGTIPDMVVVIADDELSQGRFIGYLHVAVTESGDVFTKLVEETAILRIAKEGTREVVSSIHQHIPSVAFACRKRVAKDIGTGSAQTGNGLLTVSLQNGIANLYTV